MHRQHTLRIFISSPSDALEERRCAQGVIDRLNGQSIDGRRYTLKPLLWEQGTPAVVGITPQVALEQYVSNAGDVDIYVAIFRRRVGTPVVVQGCRYESGTLREFRDANSSRLLEGRPEMLLYRSRLGRPESGSRQDDDQIGKVDAFFGQSLVCDGDLLSFDGFVGEFDDLDGFAERLDRDLRAVITRMAKLKHRRSTDLIDGVKRFLKHFEQVSLDERLPVIPIRRQYRTVCARSGGGVELPRAGIDELEHIFRQSGWSMSIVGEQGSGKTFEMWRLMQLLLHRARRAPPGDAHVPIYFNLASWAATYERDTNAAQQPLDAWFVDELVGRYSLSRRVARHVVGDREIIFCLDGLDELIARRAPTADAAAQDDRDVHPDTRRLRGACVAAINETMRQRPAARVVLCCRSDVYWALNVRPELKVEVQLQPLEESQVMFEMSRWVGQDALRAAFNESPFLCALARNPLYLRLMQTAYMSDESHFVQNERDPEQVRMWNLITTTEKDRILSDANEAAGSPSATTSFVRTLVAKYIERSLPAATGRPEKPPEKEGSGLLAQRRYYNRTTALKHLSWMSVHLPKDFLVEELQPSLLSKVTSTRRYRWHSVALMTLILAICGAIPPGAATLIEWRQHHSWSQALAQGGVIMLIIVSAVLTFGIPAFLTSRWLVFGVCLGLAFGVARGAVVGLSAPEAGTGYGLQTGIKAAALTFACATVVFSLLGRQILPRSQGPQTEAQRRRTEIVPLETWNWTWFDRATKLGGWVGLLVGPLIGLSFLVAGFGAARAAAFGIVVTVLVALFAGLGGTAIRISLRPNQGIERSLRHATRMAFLLTLVAALACGVSYGAVFGSMQGLVNAVHALVFAFAFLMFGGIPVIRHVCLGHELHRIGTTPTWWCVPPWRATVVFLDDMVRFQILRRSAGGYAFRHSVLREYFRSLGRGEDDK